MKICRCDANVKRLQPNKLDPKLDKCFFIGYPKGAIECSFYHRTKDKVVFTKNGTNEEKE